MDGRFPTSDTPADDLGQLNDPTSNTFLVEHLCVWACLLGLGDNKCDCKSRVCCCACACSVDRRMNGGLIGTVLRLHDRSTGASSTQVCHHPF